ncbi:MAG: hypothetical protein GF349_01840 [Candidatus Magasanikbacteria bacterium]|nr:hypothetical protein [Candidatus Magasanikbacteria bacterium]
MRFIIIFTTILFSLFWTEPLYSEMTGGNYEIYGDVFSFVDTSYSTSTDYGIYDSGGEFFATSTSGGTYELRGGFQALEKGFLSFSISSSSLNLGTLSTTAVANSSLNANISTDSETGYSLTVVEDGNLRSGANDIDDVLDGTVSVGDEEYGIRTSGTDGLLSSDTAMDGTITVASASGQVTSRNTEVIFSAVIDTGSIAGSYSHVVTFTATVNP